MSKSNIDHCERRLIRRMAITYILMKNSSYAKLAEKYKVSKSFVQTKLKTDLPKLYPFLSDLVEKKSYKNLLRGRQNGLKKANAKK